MGIGHQKVFNAYPRALRRVEIRQDGNERFGLMATAGCGIDGKFRRCRLARKPDRYHAAGDNDHEKAQHQPGEQPQAKIVKAFH